MGGQARLGLLTDLRALPESTRVVDRDSYKVVMTEAFPAYWFGNFLALAAPPDPQAVEHWFALCRRELGHLRGLHKLILDWETGPDGIFPIEALSADVQYECGRLLGLSPVDLPARDVPGIEARPLSGEAEWQALTDLACAEFGDPAYERWRMAAYRESVDAGKGRWWGAWKQGRLVASCGVFEASDYLRFQEVVTRTGHRGQGICSMLCTQVLQGAWSRMPQAMALIVAEPGSVAEHVYQSLGFKAIGLQHALLRAV